MGLTIRDLRVNRPDPAGYDNRVGDKVKAVRPTSFLIPLEFEGVKIRIIKIFPYHCVPCEQEIFRNVAIFL